VDFPFNKFTGVLLMKMHQIGILLLGLMAALLCGFASNSMNFGVTALALTASGAFVILLTIEMRSDGAGSYGFTQPARTTFASLTAILAAAMIWGGEAAIWSIQTGQPQFFGLDTVGWISVIGLPFVMTAWVTAGVLGWIVRPYRRTAFAG
jgi:hypothetical protein